METPGPPRATLPVKVQPEMVTLLHTQGMPSTQGPPRAARGRSSPWAAEATVVVAVRFLHDPCADQAKIAPPDAFATFPSNTLSRITAEPRSEKMAPPVLCVAPMAVLLMKRQSLTSIRPHIQVYSAPPW
jgi:hypothetical protein